MANLEHPGQIVEIEETIPIEESGSESTSLVEQSYDKIELEHEIECPRCHDIMTLYSGFDSLYYSCGECGFTLYGNRHF